MFWNRPKILGTFRIEHHHQLRQVVFATKLDEYDRLRVLVHHFDRQVNLGKGKHGDDLFRYFDHLAGRLLERVQNGEGGNLGAHVPAPEWLVVPAASSEEPIIFEGVLREDSAGTIIDEKVPLFAVAEMESIVAQGAQALLLDALRTGSKEMQFFLTVALGAATSDFRLNGIPGVFGFGRASCVALRFVEATARGR